jgi:hypothetical protein
VHVINRLSGRWAKIPVALAIAVCLAATAAAQRGRRFGGGGFYLRPPANPPYDGAFQFCGISFT